MTPALTLPAVLSIVALALLAAGIVACLALGRRLASQSRRIVALEKGTAAFVTDKGISETVLHGLAMAEDGRTDEVAKLARAARGAMQNILHQEQQLQIDQQRFRDMAEMASDWFWEQDADYRFTYMSEELTSITGVVNGGTLGKARWELPILGVSDEAWAAHRALLERRESIRDFEYQIRNRANQLRWFSVSGKPVFDAQGRFTGYRGTGRDITRRKHNEIASREREQRLRALLELSSDWYWEQDTNHRLTLREGGVLQRAGLRADFDLGKTHWEIGYINMGEADWAAHRALLDRREEFRDLLLGRRGPDGRVLWGSLSGRPRYDDDGRFIGYHGVGRGVTAQVDAERAMRESMAELRLIMENAPVSVGYFDRELVLRFVNRGFERLWERDAASLVGKHLREIVGDDAYRTVEPHFAGALHGNAVSYRRINDAPGTAKKTLDVSVVPHRDEAGQVIGVYGIGMDVTGMVQAEEEVRSLQHLFTSTFQNTTDLMAIYRVDGNQLIIEGFNQALWRFYEARFPDVRMADWAGRPIDAFLRDVTHLTQEQCDTRLIPFWKAVRHARLERYQTDLPTPAGTQRRDTLLVPITNANGAVTHLFYRGADITELMKKEEELQALNTELEHKVAARTADLSAANRELEAFAYAVSHDLRTPLRGIDGFSRLLVEESGATLGPSGISHLQRIRHGIQRMGELIDDLLRLSRVTRGPLVRSAVDLSALAAEVGAELARLAPARNVEWRIQPGIVVSADPGLMRLLLDNLLGNAFKYSRHVVHAVIEFEAAPVPGGIELWVRDNGAGFDMAYADKLFQPFQRLHGPKEFEGTGVGLATAHRIVSRHGGTIEAHGETGKGARFRIVLPLPQEGT